MKYILFLLVSLSIISCKNEEQIKNSNSPYKLEGDAIGFNEGAQIYVYKINKNRQPEVIDTLTVKNGKFSASYPSSKNLSVKFLSPENTKENILFITDDNDIKVTLYKDSLSSSYATGGLQNKIYKEYYDAIRTINKEKQHFTEQFKQARREKDNELASQFQGKLKTIQAKESQYKRQFVQEHSNSLLSVLLLTEMVRKKEIAPNEAKEIIEKFSPKVATNPLVASLNKTIKSLYKASIGGIAPNFSAPTPDGKTLALKDVLGKYTLIDFWASWCAPCRRENPHVVSVYNKYHDKGLNIISVSLDKPGQKDRWLQAIEKDKMTWHHISNLKGWKDPIAKQYGVRSIPATFLLDENGKIIAKNLRGNALDKKIASLLGE